MEIFDVSVSQGISSSISLGWIEDQQVFEKVEGIFGGHGEHGGKGFLFGDIGAGDDVGSQGGLNGFNIFLGRPADKFQDLLDLIQGGIAREN